MIPVFPPSIRALSLFTAVAIFVGLSQIQPGCSAKEKNTLLWAHEFYRQRNYRMALPLLLEASKSNPQNPKLLLWAANCYLNLGDKNYARQTCIYIIRNYSGSQEAASAGTLLQKIAPPGKTTEHISASDLNTISKIRVLEEDEKDIAASAPGMIELVRPQADHPPVSANVEHCVRQAFLGLPAAVLELFRKNNLKVCISTTLLDKEPSLKNRPGRGYDGYTYRACPGMFNGKEIIICEKTIDDNDDSLRESRSLPDIVNTFYHECGHAIDYYKGNISQTEEFKHAYLLDSAKIEPETKAELAYFLQKSAAGQEECCGELISILLGNSDKRVIKMKAAFPLTIQLLKNKISNAL